MRVVSINVGSREVIQDLEDGERYETGINKRPVDSIEVGVSGLHDDAVCDEQYHGGVDQAVYLYRAEDYAYWSQTLGRDVGPGDFGDNLTVEELPDDLAIGDVLTFDTVRLQVTAPRIPCNTLAAKMGDKHFPKQFIAYGQSGHYCRVLRPGRISAGESFTIEPYDGNRVPTATFFRDWLARGKLSKGRIEAYLAIPIDIRSRTVLEELLAR